MLRQNFDILCWDRNFWSRLEHPAMRSISHNPNIIFIFWTFICSYNASCCVLDPRTFFMRIETFVLFYKICMVQLWSDWKNLVHENELLIFINRMASFILLVTIIIYTIGGLCNECILCAHMIHVNTWRIQKSCSNKRDSRLVIFAVPRWNKV
jgi:hypothetical protein